MEALANNLKPKLENNGFHNFNLCLHSSTAGQYLGVIGSVSRGHSGR